MKASDTRELTTRYLILPLHLKCDLARKLGCWQDGDAKLSDKELGEKIFKHANQHDKIEELWEFCVGRPLPGTGDLVT